jgi:hypothetical protein
MARSSSRHRIHKAPPKPVEPPCPLCDGAYWRSNGRAWWACDRITGRRHVCTTPAALAQGQAVVAAGEVDRRALAAARGQRQRRASMALKLGLATAVAVLAGIWIYARDTE